MKSKITEAAVLIFSLGLAASAQNAASPAETRPAAAQSGAEPEDEIDRFPQARNAADEARKSHERIESQNIGEVDRLLRTRRCQSTRINGLIDRTSGSLDTWLTAERFYWTSWNDAETRRVESQQKSLTSLETDQKRAADLVDSDKRDREELLRRKSELEKSPRSAQITAEIDGLISDIQDSEARLAEAQKQFDDITTSLTNMRASLTARLVNIRQNLARLDTFRLEEHSRFEDKRKAAQEICNAKQPDTRKSPLSSH